MYKFISLKKIRFETAGFFFVIQNFNLYINNALLSALLSIEQFIQRPSKTSAQDLSFFNNSAARRHGDTPFKHMNAINEIFSYLGGIRNKYHGKLWLHYFKKAPYYSLPCSLIRNI